MMRFLRSQSQTVLVIVLGGIGLGFLFYGTAGTNLLSGAGGHVNDYGRIDGDDISVAQLYDVVRSTRQKFSMSGQLDKIPPDQAAKDIAEEAWGQLLLQREADKLHITISDQQVVERIKQFPNFQKDGVFSPDLYKLQMQILQLRLRVPTDGSVDVAAATQATFENLIREELRSDATVKALFGNVRGSAQEADKKYREYYGTTTMSYVVFDPATMAGSVQVMPADIENEYKEHPTNPAYRTKEKRKVDYVLFSLTPEQQKLPAEQKAKAKDALGQQALDFALAFQPEPSASGATPPPAPDFQAEAKKRNLTPVTTDFFTDDTSPAGLPPSPGFNSTAFTLTKDNPISKVVELDNGVVVIHLDEIQPSELKPLDEVKADIEKQLRQSKSVELAQAKASEASKALKAAMAKGSDFKTAAAALKLMVTTTPSFIPIKEKSADPKLQTLAYASVSLQTGETSGPIPVQTDNSYLIAHLDSRVPPIPTNLADEARIQDQQDEQLRGLAFTDWVQWKSKQPGTHTPPDLDAYGGVE